MVRSDLGGAGVMFSIDTETGFDKVVVINASWGLGENVVQGAVDPDEYQVFKPLLSDPLLIPIIEKNIGAKAQKMIYASDGNHSTSNVPTSKAERSAFVLGDDEIITLAHWACAIESHYGCPMDMEWAKDGESGELFIVQARPETVQSRRQAGALKTYRIKSKGRKLVSGLSIGEAVTTGRTCLIESPREIGRFVDGVDSRHADDGSGLGADHEAGRGDRHRSRRAHVARRHRQPRARACRRSSAPAMQPNFCMTSRR